MREAAPALVVAGAAFTLVASSVAAAQRGAPTASAILLTAALAILHQAWPTPPTDQDRENQR